MNTETERIKPETLKLLERQAKIFGFSVDEYLRNLLPKTDKEIALRRDDEFEADMLVFAENLETFSDYSGNYSREDIYFDHD